MAGLRFTKMQGLGNDFVVLDATAPVVAQIRAGGPVTVTDPAVTATHSLGMTSKL